MPGIPIALPISSATVPAALLAAVAVGLARLFLPCSCWRLTWRWQQQHLPGLGRFPGEAIHGCGFTLALHFFLALFLDFLSRGGRRPFSV
ncbi:MAG: hypothetical protein R3E18_08730 [Sphingomonadaceae bacterium]